MVGRGYLQPLAAADYIEGRHNFLETVHEGPDSIFGVDQFAKKDAVVAKLKGKFNKCCAKPKARPFWLLIRTVRADFHLLYTQGGVLRTSPAVCEATEFLISRGGAHPFDEV